MTKTKTGILLAVVTLTALILRVYHSNSYPSLLWDEASLGYNAYSILHTAKDEYGKIFPLILKSFGDYKPGFYVYLALPFISLFGLNELAVRLPSIIIGSLTPLLVYILIKQINPKAKTIGLIAAFICTFNPYNIHFSKGAWETNILTFELILAAYFFFKFISTFKSKFLIFSAITFGTTLFTYQAGKMISLFLILILFCLNAKILKNKIKAVLISFVLPLFFLSLPIIYGLLFNQDSNRLQVVSLFSYPRSQQETQQLISESGLIDYDLFHNHFIFFTRNFLTRYLNHFSPRFLVFEGDWQDARNSAPYIGVILYPSLIFLVIGLSSILNNNYLILNLFFLLWLLLAPVPAALTRDTIQAVRSMSISIPIIYFIASGIFILFKIIPKHLRIPGFILLTAAYLLSFIYYSDLYYNHMTKKSPNDLLYGYKQAAEFVVSRQSNFSNIYFSDFYGQPYIFYLFYSRYSPVKYQSQAKLIINNSKDTGKIESIDNIRFTSPDWKSIKNQHSVLAIFSHDEILRQGIDKSPDFSRFLPISPINSISTFYAVENP